MREIGCDCRRKSKVVVYRHEKAEKKIEKEAKVAVKRRKMKEREEKEGGRKIDCCPEKKSAFCQTVV